MKTNKIRGKSFYNKRYKQRAKIFINFKPSYEEFLFVEQN